MRRLVDLARDLPRDQIANALPGILLAIFFMTWLPEDNLFGRVIASIFLGVIFQALSHLALLVASHFVASVGGKTWSGRPVGDPHVTGAILLVVSVWILGHHWVSRQERQITTCVNNAAQISHLPAAEDMADFIHQCANPPEVWKNDDSD